MGKEGPAREGTAALSSDLQGGRQRAAGRGSDEIRLMRGVLSESALSADYTAAGRGGQGGVGTALRMHK